MINNSMVDAVAASVLEGSLPLRDVISYLRTPQVSVTPQLPVTEPPPVRINDVVIDAQNPNEVQLFDEDFDYDDFSVETNESVEENLNEKEFFLGMLGKFLFSNFSRRKVQKEINMDKLLNRPSITMAEYNNFLNDIESRYRIRKNYICPACLRVIPKIKKCVCNQKLVRGKGSTVILVTTCSIRMQLKDVIEKNFEELTSTFTASSSRIELTDFPGNKPVIKDGRRVLNLMINTDGVCPKQSFRILARKDWIAQVSSLESKSENFTKLVKSICPAFNYQQAIYSTAVDENFSDNSIVHYRNTSGYGYGKIVSSSNNGFLIRTLDGQSLISCVNDDNSIPVDLQNGLNLLNAHPGFGIRVRSLGNSVHIRKSDIISHFCRFSDRSFDYVFSLDFKCPALIYLLLFMAEHQATTSSAGAPSPPPLPEAQNYYSQQPRFDPIQDLYNRLYALENRLVAIETSIGRLEHGVGFLTSSVERIDNKINTVSTQFEAMKALVGEGENESAISQKYLFDPTNIKTDTKDQYKVAAKLYDAGTIEINIYDCAKGLKACKRSSNERFSSDLFKAIVKKIYGGTNLQYYSAATKKSEHTSVADVVDVIKRFIVAGYVTESVTELERQFIQAWVNKSIDRTCSYYFSNARRTSSKNETEQEPSPSQRKTKKRRLSQTPTPSRYNRLYLNESEESS